MQSRRWARASIFEDLRRGTRLKLYKWEKKNWKRKMKKKDMKPKTMFDSTRVPRKGTKVEENDFLMLVYYEKYERKLYIIKINYF